MYLIILHVLSFLEFHIGLSKTSDHLGEQVLEEAKAKQFFDILETFHQDTKDFFKKNLKLTLDNISREVLICKVDEFDLLDFYELHDKGVAVNEIKTFLKETVGWGLEFAFKIDIVCILSVDFLEAIKR